MKTLSKKEYISTYTFLNTKLWKGEGGRRSTFRDAFSSVKTLEEGNIERAAAKSQKVEM